MRQCNCAANLEIAANPQIDNFFRKFHNVNLRKRCSRELKVCPRGKPFSAPLRNLTKAHPWLSLDYVRLIFATASVAEFAGRTLTPCDFALESHSHRKRENPTARAPSTERAFPLRPQQ
jgi:hypothetical protein